MSAQLPSAVELEFVRRYDHEHARDCLAVKPQGLARRLWFWRGEQLVRHALGVAGEPGLVLDVACGAGRFWPVLAEHANRVILAADPSQDMLDHARTHHGQGLLQRIKTFQSSAFSIGLSANAVDCVLCLQLFQHLPSAELRVALLREFHRVSRDTVIVAVRVDRPIKPRQRTSGQLLANKAEIESEFRAAGFRLLKHQDLLPGCALTRVYVLRKLG